MLKLVEPFELHKKDFDDPDRIHLMVQAKQISYHDRDRWLGDPAFTDMPMAQLLSDAYLDQRRNLINREKALAWDQVPSYGSLRGDTVYIAVVDEHGQAVSLIHSLYGAFGSGVVSPRQACCCKTAARIFLCKTATRMCWRLERFLYTH
jgi:gamma-glutamyltranspeptidase/glutathione hydrolase